MLIQTFPQGDDMIGETKSLHPAFKIAVDRILTAMRARGWDATIGSGMRTLEQQAALFAQGRESLERVNCLRDDAGLPPISASENKDTVTNARPGQSNHNLTMSFLSSGRSTFYVVNGYAVDIVSSRHGWHPNQHFWRDLGILAKQYGCEWGGDWKHKPDPAHVQMKLIDSGPRTSTVV